MPLHISNEGLDASIKVSAINELGETVSKHVATERALTIHLDNREIVTLMTLGTQPELLTLGWLLNQRLIKSVSDVKSIIVKWDTDSVGVITNRSVDNIEEKLKTKTVTTGCGQGAMYGDMIASLNKLQLPKMEIKQSLIYDLLQKLNKHNEIYKQAGAVHGCALCENLNILRFVEDVGRHNAVDAIAGYMAMNHINGTNKVFYTTGRLTSEMVIKVAQMEVPILLSRSGTTHMALQLARKVGVTLISRAKGRHFLAYTGAENIEMNVPLTIKHI